MPRGNNAKNPSRCPMCGKPVVKDHAPFCSPGCKDRDLLQWLGDGYRVAGPPAPNAGLPHLDEED